MTLRITTKKYAVDFANLCIIKFPRKPILRPMVFTETTHQRETLKTQPLKGTKVKISANEDSFEFCEPLHGDILGPGVCSTFEG